MTKTILHPYQHAIDNPDRPAFVVADTGQELTYRELDAASNRIAHLFRQHGLRPGDRVGVILYNSIDFPIVYWGAQRSGIILALISSHLKAEEAAYILRDSQSKLLIIAGDISEAPSELVKARQTEIPHVETIYDINPGSLPGTLSLHSTLEGLPSTPILDEISGYHLLYSSGTTGRPKGIAHHFEHGPIERLSPSEGSTAHFESFERLVTFNAGPVYHGAPLNTLLLTHRLGGTLITLRRFDSEAALRAIQSWRVVVAQFVPTMFVRMLALPKEVREKYDLSSLQYVAHAAAPCAVEVKQQMMDWFGPIIHEYYSSTENVGATYIKPEEWLRKPGSVGRTVTGKIHICDEVTGEEKQPGETGLIYFELSPGRGFRYLNDPEKTAKVCHPTEKTWCTPGDIGYLDEDGFLFLTDRKDFTIISGGVNIYPQIIEDTLIVHPNVIDAAVIGIPNREYGEEVKAIIQPIGWQGSEDHLRDELTRWCRERISAVYCPRSFVFIESLPRLPSGKLAKHELRRLYGTGTAW